MVDIPMGTVDDAIITTEDEPDILIGLASEDAQLIVVLEHAGPQGPPGPQGTSVQTYVQQDAPTEDLHAGDMWIKKPPALTPQPTFIWDGTAWLPIYGEGGGAGTGGYFEYAQATPATHWVIPHLLHYEPAVTVKNAAGNTVRGSVTHVNDDNLTIDFSEPIAGVAYLS